MPHLFGLVLRRRFQRAGIVVVMGGFPLPSVHNRGRIEVENCAFYSGVRLECWEGGLIRIGNGTYMNRGAEVVSACEVTMGKDCKIARDVIIMDTDQHALPNGELVAESVVIGDRVWIGARAIVLKGVHVGHDAACLADEYRSARDVPDMVVKGPVSIESTGGDVSKI